MSAERDHAIDALRTAGARLLARVEAVMAAVDLQAFIDLVERLGPGRRTFVVGAGRSGLVARSFGMRLMHAGLEVFVPGETVTPAAARGDLLVAVSCTGSTGYTDYLARRARTLGAEVTVLTAEPTSPLARSADHLIVIPAQDANIVTRAAVFEHAASLCLDAVFDVLAERFQVDAKVFQSRHANLE